MEKTKNIKILSEFHQVLRLFFQYLGVAFASIPAGLLCYALINAGIRQDSALFLSLILGIAIAVLISFHKKFALLKFVLIFAVCIFFLAAFLDTITFTILFLVEVIFLLGLICSLLMRLRVISFTVDYSGGKSLEKNEMKIKQSAEEHK